MTRIAFFIFLTVFTHKAFANPMREYLRKVDVDVQRVKALAAEMTAGSRTSCPNVKRAEQSVCVRDLLNRATIKSFGEFSAWISVIVAGSTYDKGKASNPDPATLNLIDNSLLLIERTQLQKFHVHEIPRTGLEAYVAAIEALQTENEAGANLKALLEAKNTQLMNQLSNRSTVSSETDPQRRFREQYLAGLRPRIEKWKTDFPRFPDQNVVFDSDQIAGFLGQNTQTSDCSAVKMNDCPSMSLAGCRALSEEVAKFCGTSLNQKAKLQTIDELSQFNMAFLKCAAAERRKRQSAKYPGC